MILKALFAYLHYLSFIVLISTLVFELFVLKPQLDKATARLIQKVDGLYGLSAISVLVTGGIRLFYMEKGYAYYIANNIFITKLCLFLLVGLLSIYPTIVFIKWRKQLKSGETIQIPKDVYKKTALIVRLEVVFALFIPLLAALAARGIEF